MLKIAIYDNQPDHAELLRRAVASFSIRQNIDISLEVYDSSNDLLKSCFSYQILILSAELQEGLELGKMIRSQGISALIILVSSHLEYCMKGYEIEAFRYLLKPINETLFHITLEECINKLNSDDKKLQIRTEHGIEFITISDILYIESVLRRRNIFLVNEMHTTWHSLTELMELLPESTFEYSNRSNIINLRHVHRIQNQIILMDNGKEIPLSRNNQTRFINKTCQYFKQEF